MYRNDKDVPVVIFFKDDSNVTLADSITPGLSLQHFKIDGFNGNFVNFPDSFND